MKTGRPKIKISTPLTAELRKLLGREKSASNRDRLRVVLLASQGQHTHQELAAVVGRGSSSVFRWIKAFTAGGIEELLGRKYRGGRKGALDEMQQEALREALIQGKFRTHEQGRLWLEVEHGVKLTGKGMEYWLKKLGAVLRVPRPCHIAHNVAKAEAFKSELFEKLQALPLEHGREVLVWVEDEHRYGRHAFTRRVWTLPGHKVVVPTQQVFEWGYLYGALEVTRGHAEFAFLPQASLEATGMFYEQIARSFPHAQHVIIQDGAGFHPRQGSERLPARVHVLSLPAHSPQLNPPERLWDIVKDSICNRAYESMEALEDAMTPVLRSYWESSQKVLSLIGQGWLRIQSNA